jgi:hypothetical protein
VIKNSAFQAFNAGQGNYCRKMALANSVLIIQYFLLMDIVVLTQIAMKDSECQQQESVLIVLRTQKHRMMENLVRQILVATDSM